MVRFKHARDQIKGGRLTSPIWSDQSMNLACTHRQVGFMHRLDSTKTFADGIGFQHRALIGHWTQEGRQR